MSAYIVDKHHIGYLIHAAMMWECGIERGDFSTAREMAEMLWYENLRSVTYRYGSGARELVPSEPMTFEKGDLERMYWREFRRDDLGAMPIQVIKSAQCLIYQSCEHPEWEESKAHRFLNMLINRAIDHLHGYEEAVWGAPEPAN